MGAEPTFASAQRQHERASTPTARLAPGKSLSVDVMRTVVTAIRAGRFDVPTMPIDAPNSLSHPAVSHIRSYSSDGSLVIAVVGGHAGAGASTVALALSEGMTDRASVHLYDWHLACRSGLAAAVTQELETELGWRQGRRGPLLVSRRLERDAVRPPIGPSADSPRVAVVDLGHLMDDDLWALSSASSRVVVATRVSVPGVRQTERVLSLLSEDALVVGIGPRHWPGSVEVSCGPRLRDLRKCHHVIAMPVHRGLAVAGLTTDPLPRQVAAAGRRIAALLQPGLSEAGAAAALTVAAEAS
jgi:hypothetical protein